MKRGGMKPVAVCEVFALFLGLVLVGVAFGARADSRVEFSNLSLSSGEARLLKDIDRIQKGAGLAFTVLSWAPLAQMVSAPDPASVSVTILSSDFQRMTNGLRSIRKIEACKIVEAFLYWRIDNHVYSSGEAERFFERIRQESEARCTW